MWTQQEIALSVVCAIVDLNTFSIFQFCVFCFLGVEKKGNRRSRPSAAFFSYLSCIPSFETAGKGKEERSGRREKKQFNGDTSLSPSLLPRTNAFQVWISVTLFSLPPPLRFSLFLSGLDNL